jgi:class 3 adenylate cyclase
MSQLDTKKRARLPDSAFAYIDSRGRRRLPINDEAHVRNALARFNQTPFEDDAARGRARTKLLKAAKKYGIVPVGFITGQLKSQSTQAAAGQAVIDLGGMGAPGELEERLRAALGDQSLSLLQWSDSAAAYLNGAGQAVTLPADGEGRAVTLLERHGRPMTALVHEPAVLRDPNLAKTVTAAVRLAIENERLQGEVEARASEVSSLPAGFVTFLLADVEDSTGLVRRLGDRYAALLTDVRRLLRTAVRTAGGREVDARGDELFAVFEHAPAALGAGLAIQNSLRDRAWPKGVEVRVRVGIHSGHPTLTDTGYVGLAVHAVARISFAAHGRQIILSRAAREAVEGSLPPGIGFRDLGMHQLQGMPQPEALFQVEGPDLPTDFPPPRIFATAPA